MPVVCDYAPILDGSRQVTPSSDFTARFNSGGRETGKAVLMFDVKSNGEGRVTVQINGVRIGHVEKYVNMHPDNWFSQKIIFDASVLSSSDSATANVLQIELEQGDLFVKDIVCFFKQNV